MGEKINSRADRLARAAALRDAGRLDEAKALYEALARAEPLDPEPHHHLGGLHERAGRLAAAEAAWRRVLELAPGAAGAKRVLATLLLSQGRYAEGFELFEARHALPDMRKPELPFPEWRGEPVDGRRVLIWPEQGFGDQIQFARFAPVLKAKGAEVTLICRAPLQRLFAGCLGVEVLAAEGAVEFADPDAWVMTCSLAGRLGVTPQSLPSEPYLHAVSAWPAIADGGRKVGLATRGNPAFVNDAQRSLPEPAARRLAQGLSATVVDLDPAYSGARDFADTAAIIDQLDLVIAVDTAAAHLAGAMGKPCWLLLSRVWPDWRWMRGRADSPWYPSMRLFRQPRRGDWEPVVDEVLAAFAAEVV